MSDRERNTGRMEYNGKWNQSLVGWAEVCSYKESYDGETEANKVDSAMVGNQLLVGRLRN